MFAVHGYCQFDCMSVSVVCPLLLQEVPDELWELLELEKLNLSLNNLKVLPPQLALLSNLVVLNLWGNQVTSTGFFSLASHRKRGGGCLGWCYATFGVKLALLQQLLCVSWKNKGFNLPLISQDPVSFLCLSSLPFSFNFPFKLTKTQHQHCRVQQCHL